MSKIIKKELGIRIGCASSFFKSTLYKCEILD